MTRNGLRVGESELDRIGVTVPSLKVFDGELLTINPTTFNPNAISRPARVLRLELLHAYVADLGMDRDK